MQRKVEDVDTKNLPIGRELMMMMMTTGSLLYDNRKLEKKQKVDYIRIL